MRLTTPEEIKTLLERIRTIALVGASPKEARPSNRVLKYLLRQGYDVYPVNPGQAGREIAGRKVFARLSDIPVPIEMVDVFRRSSELTRVVDDAINIKAQVLWTQLGVVDENALARAEEAGLTCVVNRCPAIDIPKFGIRTPAAV